ncbi:hypothetical protein MCOR25_000599 [Pyricularia grisea]|nr:hypothetical protein MCOR25_000599 [Pyricularia grisea]
MSSKKAILVGISGCSSSGKTTLARLIRDIFPNTFILHEDDFYKPESELPKRAGHADWDCVGSLNIDQMEKSLTYIRENGQFPPDLNSIEDQNAVGKCPVSDAKIQELKTKVEEWSKPDGPGHGLLVPGDLGLCILDGFLLYTPPLKHIMSLLDLKFFLLVSRATAIRRREARIGYVTVEGFWADPEGYATDVVWPNYAESHAWLFKNGDVEGELDMDAVRDSDILVQADRGTDVDMEITLEWVVEELMRELPRVAAR